MSTILIVDDSHVNRALVCAVLRAAGHDVHEAEDGEAARKMWRARSFDLVLMDMRLPDADGETLTREMRAEGYDQPVVASFSADITAELPAPLVEAGFDAFVGKPINPMSFGGVIAKLIAEGRRGG